MTLFLFLLLLRHRFYLTNNVEVVKRVSTCVMLVDHIRFLCRSKVQRRGELILSNKRKSFLCTNVNLQHTHTNKQRKKKEIRFFFFNVQTAGSVGVSSFVGGGGAAGGSSVFTSGSGSTLRVCDDCFSRMPKTCVK